MNLWLILKRVDAMWQKVGTLSAANTHDSMAGRKHIPEVIHMGSNRDHIYSGTMAISAAIQRIYQLHKLTLRGFINFYELNPHSGK